MPQQRPRQAAFRGKGCSSLVPQAGGDTSGQMQVKIAAGDSAGAAQSAAPSSDPAVPVEEQRRPRGGASEQLREGGDSCPTVGVPVHVTPPPATAGSVSCGSRVNSSSSSSSKRDGSHSTDKRKTSKPATAAVGVPPRSGQYAVRAGASSASACGGNSAVALTAGPGAAGTFTEAAATPANAAAGGPGRGSSQHGAAEDAALNRRVCAAVQLLVKTLVSTEDIVVSLAEMPEALRQRPATLSFATVRAKILFSRYFFKKLKIYKTKRTRCFAVPAVIHTETGLIHASGSPIDWPRGLAARVLASQQPAAAAAPAAFAGGRSGGMPVDSKGGDTAAATVAAAGTAAAFGWAAAVPAPSTAKGVTTPAASAAAAGIAAAAHGLLGVTSSSSSTTLPTGPQRRCSSNNSGDCRTAAPHSSSKGSSDSTGSRSTPSEESSEASVTVSGCGTCLLEGSAHTAYQQQGVVHQTPQHHHAAVYDGPTKAGLAFAGGRGLCPSESTSVAALRSSACASAAIAPGADGGRGAAGGGGAAAAAAGRPGAAAETAAATATLHALVQGKAPSKFAAECSVRDIVSSRFLHWHTPGGGFTDQQQRIWEKSSSALVSGGGNSLFEERADLLMSNNSSSSFTLVSFLFTPLPGKGLLSQPKDAAAEASQEAPAAASDVAAVERGGRGRRAAADAGAAAAARATELEAENTAAATLKGREEEEEERRRSHSPRGLGAAAGQEDAAKKTAAAAAATAGAAAAETTRATTAGAGVWEGYNYSLPSTQEEAAARINSLLQNEQLLGIRGFDKAAGGSRRRSRYKVTCSVVCGADSWAIGRIELGSHCMSGQRSYNEDRVCVMPILDTQDGSRKRPNSKAMFCAVYDGHNGEDAVNYVQEHLHRNIAKSKAFQGDMLKAIRAGFMATDTALRAMVCERIRNVGYDDDDVSPFSSGSTACTALLRGTQLYVGNLGDSRCVLSRAARSHLITVDHSCRTNAEEQRRVKQDGGHFDTDGYLSGALGVSRAFGAFDKKGGQKLSGLSGEPEIHRETLRREDEFMIIACDGVFDVVSCQEAVTCVRTHLREGKSADDAAMGLCQLAFQRHSLDNLSAVVAVFQSPEPLQKEKQERKEKRPPQHSKAPGEAESTAAAGEGCRPRRKVINFSALKGLL